MRSVCALATGMLGILMGLCARSEAAAPSQPSTERALPLPIVTQIGPATFWQLAFGDSDHDGNREVFLTSHDANFNFSYKIYEYQSGQYVLDFDSNIWIYPYTLSDAEQVGKTEVVGLVVNTLYVYESPDASSYPTQLVYSYPTAVNSLGATSVADTDRDGKQEIIHEVGAGGAGRLLILENTGDNTYQQVYYNIVSAKAVGQHVIADLDGDGLTEIAVCQVRPGWLHVLESPANNTWVETFSESLEVSNAYTMVGGIDSDDNGYPELFIMGNYGNGWRTIVFEAHSDNKFARVATLDVPDNDQGIAFNALGNLDGLGGAEYVINTYGEAWIYQATSVGHWEIVQKLLDPSQYRAGLQCFDMNQNGRDELFWTTDLNAPSWVLEYSPSTTDAAFSANGPITMSLAPNPCRTETVVRTNIAPSERVTLAVYDAAGRLLEQRTPFRDVRGWFPLSMAQHPSGIYFIRLTSQDGRQLGTVRSIVAR